MRSIQTLATLFILLSSTVLSGCASQPERHASISPANQAKAEQGLDAFRADPRLESYFDQATVIAIYPNNTRVGLGFGAAYSNGFVYRDGQWIGRSRAWQFSAGTIGFQFYRQILFFKTEASFDLFSQGTYEFAGQANLALATLGAASTPSFNEEVALFTQLKGGALIEASVGMHHYSFRPFHEVGQ